MTRADHASRSFRMFAELFRKHPTACSDVVYGTHWTHVRIVELLTLAVNVDEAQKLISRTNGDQMLVRLSLLSSSSAPNLFPMGMPSGSTHQTDNPWDIPGAI